ncbi:DUF4856 domain-containing protein [Sediminitomix flava]|uniref:Uncharacterized protein DUF4856 n=1 Tax=Sediminitomix flava TaxID=379075 RepID=A0A315Z643_SEDFL|nr:DUF4856 domain-containing protein [Sediminitomix flava]PWJ39378.1 uncharacterized protein DUF4856 [Sediminitomix flava]
MKLKYSLLATAFLSMSLFSCEESSNDDPTMELPTSYNFENVSYSGQTNRIMLLSDLEAKMKSANDGETVVTADELTAIYENTAGNYDETKQLANKTYSGEDRNAQAEMYEYFASLEAISGNSENLIGGRLFDENGVEPTQMVAKGLMGAVLYWQATSVYFGEDKMNVDNEEVTEGKGTAMQHHWDEAFGYFGATTDYLTSGETQYYWASYAAKRAEVLDLRETIFNAFIKGRDAIDRKDYDARDEAIVEVQNAWEKLVAANVVHYINSSLANMADAGEYYHAWSEAKAFAGCLYFNANKTISNEEFAQLETLLGENPMVATKSDLEAASLLLQEVFGFTNDELLNL